MSRRAVARRPPPRRWARRSGRLPRKPPKCAGSALLPSPLPPCQLECGDLTTFDVSDADVCYLCSSVFPNATLERWRKEIVELMPYQPVQDLHKGWLEKKGEVGSAWKMRYFVLLSTRRLGQGCLNKERLSDDSQLE